MKASVAVFLRYPELGRVKTRLATTVGAGTALAIYEKLLAHTMDVLKTLPASFAVTLYGEPSTALEKYREKFPGWIVALQDGATLGDRLLAACAQELEKHEAVLCIGTDCPELRAAHLVDALTAMQTHDAVLGPAEDGGYWLLGTKRVSYRLFEGIPWSSDQVARLTEDRFTELGWTATRLATLADIDDEADAERLGYLA